MANLRANRITSTEVFETTGSVQFDGDNDNLSIADSADFTFGSGDFTMEAWIYPQQYGIFPSIINKFTTDGSSSQWFWGLEQSGGSGQAFYLYFGSTNYQIRNLGNVPLNQWTHCAVSRQGSSVRVFQNGILQGTLEVGSVSMNDTSVAVTIGTDGNNLYDFKGHISNARILKGTALYTKNFTPPTRELEVIPNTVLLCAQSKTQANQEATGKTITVNGNAVASELTPGLLTNIVKSGGSSAITGSVEFDGLGDYLNTPSNSDFSYGTGDFTWEIWLYTADIDVNRYILDHGSNGGTIAIGSGIGSGSRYYNPTTGTGSVLYTTGFGSINANSWYHFAIVRRNGTTSLYKNGLLMSSASDTHNYGSQTITIGSYGSPDPTQYYWKGFISNLRIIKGQALYTSDFIPPTRKLTRLPGTVLLCCQDNESVATEATGKTITANGNPAARRFVPQVGSDGGLVFDGVTKVNTQNYFYLPTGLTEQRFPNFEGVAAASARGLFAGSNTEPASGNTIEYITISSTGNTQDFGDRIGLGRRQIAAVASPTRAVFAGSYSPLSNIIDYVTITSTGNAQDFGDTTTNLTEATGISNSTRGIFAGGRNPTIHNVIQYVTIQSTGNSIDFGDLITSDRRNCGSCQSPTRGIIAGGRDGGGTDINLIDYITISTTGNSIDFGDLVSASHGRGVMGGGNSTRGIFAGGGPSPTNVISYVTIASTGNATDFGDNTAAAGGMNTMACSSTRACMFGAAVPARTLSYVTIHSTGNATNFGSFTVEPTSYYYSGCSNGHGGLG